MSTLERMYTYAKSTGVGARENFTTEALAGAIRAHPRPVIAVLQRVALLPDGEVSEIQLDTQVVLPGTGVLDLVIVAVINGHRHELWCEVKVEAGESGTQLDAYRRNIEALPGASRPTLFTLGREPIRADSTIPWVSWHALRRIIEQTDGTPWSDFADYLAEVHMSDDFDLPIAAREAAAMTEFQALHGKVARVVRVVSGAATERWPGLPWPVGESAIRKRMMDRFASHQELTVGVQAAKNIWLVFGVTPGDGEADILVAIQTWPSALDLQREVIARADAAGLSAEWRRPLGAWGGLRRTRRLVVLGDADAAANWLMERLTELDVAGVIELL